MNARQPADTSRQDYRPLVLLVWALLISFFHATGFFHYIHNGAVQFSAEKHHIVWMQSNTAIDEDLYRFSSSAELAQFYQQNNVHSLPLTNKPGFDIRALSSSKHDLKGPPKLNPKIAPFFYQPVSVNDAPAEILETLPGVGKKLAERIVDLRQSSGFFQGLDDLLVVRGIGKKKLNRLRTLISLE